MNKKGTITLTRTYCINSFTVVATIARRKHTGVPHIQDYSVFLGLKNMNSTLPLGTRFDIEYKLLAQFGCEIDELSMDLVLLSKAKRRPPIKLVA